MTSALALLSPVELGAARLDGDVFELGAGYLPADAPETPLLRAATLTALYDGSLAAVGMSAAWVHGACDIEPEPHLAQAVGRSRLHRHHPGLRLREVAIDPRDVIRIGGLQVAAHHVALADLALAAASARSTSRRLTARVPAERIDEALGELGRTPGAADDAVSWLRRRVTPNKRAALRLLAQIPRGDPPQADVTR